MTVTNDVKRPVLRYFGSKWRIATWIIPHFPAHEMYVDPFGGGAAILLRKSPSRVEVYNDIDEDVVAFFRVLREQPEQLKNLIDLTPWSKREMELCRDGRELDLSDLERARRMFVCAWQMYGGPRSQWKSGWRRPIGKTCGTTVAADWNNTGQIMAAAARLKHVSLECDRAENIIGRYDDRDTLFYCDPPYVHSTRLHFRERRSPNYKFEMTDFDHHLLASQLCSVKGMVILSGYRSELYDELYAGWRRIEKKSATTYGHATECIWLSPRCEEKRNG